ncbi:MAG: histidine phosphatase family protein [Waddliaceae bacterium]|jgi:phosphohistidine phosphatase SixA|nr:histidine phosphatase family protein [Waddliaceae bacterium]MBT3579430.1 histidine phosphatase family protein [Waddliaceae bacterium]MBT4445183.1 histidine phosphatase family protein [Waddliaceae bacterium]MBT6928152.1 histidine phosphatase family protein [Waddliaceae bacterium]MBT7264485.1 histidine phosphatase family protein [Waddliaceae bacterium]
MATTVVVLRHGKPVDSEGYAEDGLRPLSEEGRSVQRAVVEGLKDKNIVPTMVYTSPLVRAQETAGIVADVFDVEVQDTEALSCDTFDAEKLLTILHNSNEGSTIFFVGHAPTLGNLVNEFVGEEVINDGIAKSGVAIVTFNDAIALGNATFISYFKPEDLI